MLCWTRITVVMSKRALILSTIGAWFIACLLYGYYYVVSILESPEPYDAYARHWDFQLLMFSIFRLPLLVVALPLIIALEIIAYDLLTSWKASQVQP